MKGKTLFIFVSVLLIFLYLDIASSAVVITVNSILDPSMANFSANNSVINKNTGFLQLNITLSGTSSTYSCLIESNYTDTFMKSPDNGTNNPCYTEGSNNFCFISPPVNIVNGTGSTIGFSLPNGNWLYRVKCTPIKNIYIKVNASVSSGTAKFSFNQTSVNISEGDNLFVIDNATANSTNGNATDAIGINLTIKINSSSFFSGFGESVLSLKNVSNGSTINFTTLPNFAGGSFMPDIPSFFPNKRLVALNQSNVSQILADIPIFSTKGSDRNSSDVITLGGNVSFLYLITVNGSFKPPSYFNDSITNTSLCSVGDKFCNDLGRFGGGESNSSFFFGSFEDCYDGIDNDGNGLVDVQDPACSYLPNFNLSAVNLTNPPKVLQVKTFGFSSSTYVMVINDVPSNTSLEFFYLDSNCGQTGLNKTLTATGFAGINNSEFKQFHTFSLDSLNLGYSLASGTTYYYKIRVQDLKGNSADDTKCRSFTTSSSAFSSTYLYNFSFYTPPKTGEFAYTNYNISINGTVIPIENLINGGINATTNATLIINDSANNWTIEMIGIKVLGNFSMNMSDAFKSTSSSNTRFIGMNHTSWLQLSQLLGVDSITVTLPDISGVLQKCDDQNSNCQDITSKVTKVASTATSTKWAIPLTTGFSTYSGGSSGGSSGSSGSGGGGGSGGMSAFYLTTDGTTVIVHEGNSINFVLYTDSHELKVNTIRSPGIVDFTIDPEQISFNLMSGQTKDLDLNGDNKNDLTISLVSINNNNRDVKLLLKQTKLVVPNPINANVVQQPKQEQARPTPKEEIKPSVEQKTNNDYGYWAAIIFLIIAIIASVSFIVRKVRNSI